jgi:phosphoribosylamine---glycine ligase
MKILIVGSGGREHAILWALQRNSGRTLELYCAPGNAGMREVARCVPIEASDIASLVQFVSAEGIDFTFVGPEGPLAAGIVDEFETRGLAIAGPSRSASRLESSKAFAKQFMARHRIPTARFALATSVSEGLDLLRSGEFGAADSAVVVKADGLAAGKGVVVARSRVEAEQAVRDLLTGLVATEAVQQIVIEEALQGREASLLLFSDGNSYVLMPAARDHKRIGEGDTGPNTGGMGAITDPSVLDDDTLAQVVRDFVEPTLKGARAEGFPFRGVLFIGLMLTSEGPRVLEYNVRFGDPETQAILVRLRSDLAEVFQAIAQGTLADVNVEWTDESSACVVLASRGYPGKYETGARITGLNLSGSDEDVKIFHAGTSFSAEMGWLTNGGRVLGVTAAGVTLDEALSRCYGAIESIHWQGIQYRRDIGRFEQAAGVSPTGERPEH